MARKGRWAAVCAAVTIALAAIGTSVVAHAESASGIRAKAGHWTGHNKHGKRKLSFVVAKDGRHARSFVLRLPYTCANGTPSGVLTYRRKRRAGINSYNGYFYFTDSGLKANGLSNDVSVYMNGFFSDHGKRARKASGDLGVDFDTLDGDYCTDRFDHWKAGH